MRDWSGKNNPNYDNHGKRPEVSGERSGLWLGDDVGNDGLHKWIRENFPPPESCQSCKLVPPYDLANITGVYNRELKNWAYLCRRCHQISDGRLDRLKTMNIIDMSGRLCHFCGSNKTGTRKKKMGRRPDWRRRDGHLICAKCRARFQRQGI